MSERPAAMTLETWAIDRPIPYARNPRINSGAVGKVAASLKEFGWRQPIVVDEAGVVIVGHTRLLAAQKLGMSEVPVHIAKGLTAAQAKAYRIADNRTGEEAEWDYELLPLELTELKDAGFDLDLTGFDADGIAEVFGETREVVEDEVPDAPAAPVTQAGDLILLGRHRLLCGDSTKAEDVARVMDGKKADACVTDPPYAVKYERSQSERGGNLGVHSPYREGDNASDVLAFLDVIPADVVVMTFPVDRHFFALADSLRRVEMEVRKECVWVKDSFSFWPGSQYQQQHEPILIIARKGKPVGSDVPANVSTVFNIPRPKKHELHPTAKPVSLFVDLVKYHAPEIVYEPFCGSGTTLIAAEQLNRTCCGIEISPAYCDVIVTRWETLTGQKAQRPGKYGVSGERVKDCI